MKTPALPAPSRRQALLTVLITSTCFVYLASYALAAKATPTPKPGASPSPSPSATATPQATATASPKATATATPKASATASPTPVPLPSSSPTPSSTPKPLASPSATPWQNALRDAERDWKNTGTDFNSNANWSATTGGVAPAAGDVAWFTSAAVAQPNLSSSLNLSGLFFSSTGSSGYNITRTSGAGFTLTASQSTVGAETGDASAVAIGANNTTGANTIAVPIIFAPASGTVSTIYQAAGGTLNLSGQLSGIGVTLSKTGGGTLVLSGANTYSGGTAVNEGTLQLSGAGTLGNSSGSLTLNTGTPTTRAILDLNGTNQTVGAFNGTATDNGHTGGLLTNTASNTTSILTFGTGNTSGQFDGQIMNGTGGSMNAYVGLTKVGTGTEILTGTNTYSGDTNVNGGTLAFSAANSFGGAAVGNMIVASGATFDMSGSGSVGVLGLSGAGNVVLSTPSDSNPHQLGINGSGTFSGVISGGAQSGINRTGMGTEIFTGANTYGGGTTVTSGILLINNTSGSGTGSGPVTVAGTLGGTGRIDGAVTVNNMGTLAPGSNSAATIHLNGALTLNAQSTLLFDITDQSTKDLVAMANGSLTIAPSTTTNVGGIPFTMPGATLQLVLPNSGFDYTQRYAVFTGVGSLTGTFNSITGYDTSHYTATFGPDPLTMGQYDVFFTPLSPVPEPSTWVASALALAVIGYQLSVIRRRRRSATAGRLSPDA